MEIFLFALLNMIALITIAAFLLFFSYVIIVFIAFIGGDLILGQPIEYYFKTHIKICSYVIRVSLLVIYLIWGFGGVEAVQSLSNLLDWGK